MNFIIVKSHLINVNHIIKLIVNDVDGTFTDDLQIQFILDDKSELNIKFNTTLEKENAVKRILDELQYNNICDLIKFTNSEYLNIHKITSLSVEPLSSSVWIRVYTESPFSDLFEYPSDFDYQAFLLKIRDRAL